MTPININGTKSPQPDITLPKIPQIRVYIAKLTQTSTNSPTVTIIQNTLGNIVWTRDDVGTYIATLNNAFQLNKTSITIGINDQGGTIHGGRTDNNTIAIYTTDTSNSASDNILNNCFIEIKAYQLDNQYIQEIITPTQPYKIYTALLSQSGTNAPTATILQNTLGNIIWTRNGPGNYSGTLTDQIPYENKTYISPFGNFDTNNVFIPISDSGATIGYWTMYLDGSNNGIIIETTDETYANTEWSDIFGTTQQPIEIRVYN